MTEAYICDFCGRAVKGEVDIVIKSRLEEDWNGKFPIVTDILSGIDGPKSKLECCKKCMGKMINNFTGVELCYE